MTDIPVEPSISATTTLVVGVDTHRDIHVAHASDQLGRPLGTCRIATTTAGYQQLIDWAQGLGQVQVVAIEGIGHYGAGLGRHLRAAGIQVTEVGRPNRQRRARHGKTDAADAAGAAAMVLAGDDLGEPKTADADIESLRILRATRTGAVRSRAKAVNALKALIVTAPAALREQLTGLHKKRLLDACEALTKAAGNVDWDCCTDR